MLFAYHPVSIFPGSPPPHGLTLPHFQDTWQAAGRGGTCQSLLMPMHRSFFGLTKEWLTRNHPTMKWQREITTCVPKKTSTKVHFEGFSRGLSGKESLLPMQEPQGTWVWSLGWEDPLEKEMAPHSSNFAWRIPWTEEPGRLQSID